MEEEEEEYSMVYIYLYEGGEGRERIGRADDQEGIAKEYNVFSVYCVKKKRKKQAGIGRQGRW